MTTTKETQIQNSLFYMLPFALQNLLPFITVPIFTRILTPKDYGILALAVVYAIFMTGLANFGTTLAFERNYFKYRKKPEKLAELLYTSLAFVAGNFIVLAFLTLLLGNKLSVLLTKSPDYGMFIFCTFAAHFFFITVNQFYFIYYRNSERAKTYTKYQILISILNFTISVFLVAYLRVGVIGIIYAQLITGIILFTLFGFKFLRELPFLLNKRILIESIKISYPLTPRIFLGVLGTQFDKYMIGLLATVSGVGIYHIGKRISEVSFNFMTALQNVFNPQVYKRMFDLPDEGGESIGRYLTPFLYISILLALCIALFSEELIKILTPVSYHGAIPIITILSMYFGFLFFGKIVGTQLIFAKKTFITSLLTVSRLALNIGFNIPLIMKYGAIGAAWATLLSGLISGSISIWVAQHYYKIKWEWGKVSIIMCIFFLSSLLIVLLKSFDLEYWIMVLVKVFAISGYIFLGIRIKILSRKNLQIVKNIFSLRPVQVS